MKDKLKLLIAIGKPKTEPKNMQDAINPEAPEGSNGDTETKNMISLGKDAYPNGKDGDMVKTQVEGKLIVNEDGSKFLVAQSTDGVPVADVDEESTESPEEESSEDEGKEYKPDSSMRADEALDSFMKTQNQE